MLRAAILFFIVALLSVVFGSYGIAGVSMDIGRTLLYIFLALAVLSVIANLLLGRNNKPLI